MKCMSGTEIVHLFFLIWKKGPMNFPDLLKLGSSVICRHMKMQNCNLSINGSLNIRSVMPEVCRTFGYSHWGCECEKTIVSKGLWEYK